MLAGLDLSGRLAIVTGGYSGLGIETVAALTGAGAHTIVPARRPVAARDALQARGLRDVEVDELDLSELTSVPEARVGEGWESHFATNHLGHYVLTNLLWPALVAGGGAAHGMSDR